MIPRSVARMIVLLMAAMTLPASWAAEGQIRMAVMDLQAKGVDVNAGSIVSDFLREALVNTGKADVMERAQVEEILKEQGFQQTGLCSDDSCAVQVGRLLAIQYILVGSVAKLGTKYYVSTRLLAVQTSRVMRATSVEVDELEQMRSKMQELARFVIGDIYEVPAASATSVAKPTAASEVIKSKPKKEGAYLIPWITLGAGVVAGGVAGYEYYAGNQAFAAYEAATNEPDMRAAWAKMQTADTVRNVCYGVSGGLLLVTGGLLLLDSTFHWRLAKAPVQILPTVGGVQIQVALR